MRFFVGFAEPCHPQHLMDRWPAFISVNALRKRKSAFVVGDWIMDSGAFTEISTHGHYRHSEEEYAAEIRRWKDNGNMLAAVSQDFMCEEIILNKTGLTIAEHQRLTVERYDRLLACDRGGTYLMPVLQGYAPSTYVDHIRMYGCRLAPGAYVGVGSVCKRNSNIRAIENVLLAIHGERPDLRLHGFGIKTTALQSGIVREHLTSSDSMAWPYAARKQGRDQNDWREAVRFAERIDLLIDRPIEIQEVLFTN